MTQFDDEHRHRRWYVAVAIIALLAAAVVPLFLAWFTSSWFAAVIADPDWHSSSETGTDLLGPGRTNLVIAVGVVAAVVALVRPLARVTGLIVAAAGLTFAYSAGRVVLEWNGSGLRPAVFVTLAAGVLLAIVGCVIALTGPRPGGEVGFGRVSQAIGIVALVAVVAAAALWPLRRSTPASGFADVGPFEQVATADHHYGFSGTENAFLVMSDDEPAVADGGDVWTWDDHGRSTLRVDGFRSPESGIVDNRFVTTTDAGTTIFDVERRLWVTIDGTRPMAMATGDTLWVSSYESDLVYRVEVADLPSSGIVAVDEVGWGRELDVGELGTPAIATALELFWVVELDDGSAAVYRGDPGEGAAPVRIAGGGDQACPVADALDSRFDRILALAADRYDGLWIAASVGGDTRLYRLPAEAAGEPMSVADVEVPLTIESMLVDRVGPFSQDLYLLGSHADVTAGVWRLGDPTDYLTPLPARADCPATVPSDATTTVSGGAGSTEPVISTP